MYVKNLNHSTLFTSKKLKIVLQIDQITWKIPATHIWTRCWFLPLPFIEFPISTDELWPYNIFYYFPRRLTSTVFHTRNMQEFWLYIRQIMIYNNHSLLERSFIFSHKYFQNIIKHKFVGRKSATPTQSTRTISVSSYKKHVHRSFRRLSKSTSITGVCNIVFRNKELQMFFVIICYQFFK